MRRRVIYELLIYGSIYIFKIQTNDETEVQNEGDINHYSLLIELTERKKLETGPLNC